ncbi:hypothetical protein M0534_01575 [Methylonatrum kenyense]|uniref:hypothetical protein n=1 Tax=Methylonatrum kenyense TaxID=455253 RepID=UPI0020BFE882|nr:hypothetical protein [Methylonatrum kenyense]MCK8515021.1 hypothetical protein [Methylonatrum kenyense]
MSTHRRFQILLLAGSMLGVTACDTDPTDASGAAEVQVEAERIIDADGATVLDIDQLPAQIAADEKNRFGASDRFTDASLSPDGNWLAVTSSGAAHGGGWLVSLDDETIYPAAFQYGGSVSTGPWDDSGRFAVFLRHTPASGHMLVLADTEAPGEDAASTGITPLDTEASTSVEIGEWQDAALRVLVDGDCRLVKPIDGSIERC